MKTISIILLTFSFNLFAQENSFTVYFDFGKHTLNSTEQERLNEFKSSMNPTTKFLAIEGFTDTVGSIRNNLNLAERRITTISKTLKLASDLRRKIDGEESANKSTNYVASDFRKVTLFYTQQDVPLIIAKKPLTKQEMPIEKIEIIEAIEPPKEETSISKTVESFLKNDESEILNYDLSILFYNNSEIPLPESEPEMKELYKIMWENKNLDIVIHGHVCCSDNYEISRARAVTVYNYLQNGGIDYRRMKYVGHSNTQPKVSPEITEEDMKLNRRVTIEFIKR